MYALICARTHTRAHAHMHTRTRTLTRMHIAKDEFVATNANTGAMLSDY